jgi:excisionase family DNA binding protein
MTEAVFLFFFVKRQELTVWPIPGPDIPPYLFPMDGNSTPSAPAVSAVKEGPEPGGGVFDYKSLSAYLSVAQVTLRHWVMEGAIPFTKMGRRVGFDKKEIELWLEQNTRYSLKAERKSKPAGDTVVPAKADTGGELPFEEKDGGI